MTVGPVSCPVEGFAMTVQCAECPWRTDVEPGQFSEERFKALRSTVEQNFGPIFSCHKSTERAPKACVGYLLVEGTQNFNVRLAIIQGKLDMSKLKATGPLYGSFKEMEEANASPRAQRRRRREAAANRRGAVGGRQDSRRRKRG